MILFEMLVGKPPFEGQNYIQLMNNIETKPLKIPKSVAKAVSNNCLDLLVKLLQRDAHKRIDFDTFFQHPFIRDAPCAEGVVETRPQFSFPASPAALPFVAEEADHQKVAIGEDEEFRYTVEDDFVVVNRAGSDDGSSTEAKQDDSLCTTRLLRIADWVMDAADMTASRPQAFCRSLISVQIIQHLVKKAKPVRPELLKKLERALQKSKAISDHLTQTEVTKKCRASQIYAVFKEGALVCAQKAAADELCGQYYDSCENYARSTELLTFLVEEGSGVRLDPPFNLKSSEREKLKHLITAINERKEKCTPTAST